MFTLIVTGSRWSLSVPTQLRVRSTLGLVAYRMCPTGGLLKHGEATGVDSYASVYWNRLGPEFAVQGFPYISSLGRRGGPVRNQQMVDSGADLCLAYPSAGSKGTYDCANKAKKAGIPTFILVNSSDDAELEHWLVANQRLT